MRVLHVTPLAFGEDGIVGGGERYPVELARAMSSRVPTTLVAFGPRAVTTRVERLTCVTLPVQHTWAGGDVNPLSARLVPYIARADVIHLHQWESALTNAALVTGRALRKKVFATDHGGSARNYWRQLRLARLLTGFLPVSRFGASFYPELEPATVIYGGVDHVRWVPPPPGSPRRGAVFVGRMLPHKGLDVLLGAIPPDLPLRVIGRPYRADYRDHLGALAAGKCVSFEEHATDDDVLAAHRGARVAVLPSLLDPPGAGPAPKAELLGLALLEAMACGTPVVATRTGGMPEIVEDGVTGFVVEPGDGAALADAVRRVVELPDDRWEAMSRASRAHVVDRFTWSAVADRCLAGYRSAAGPRFGPGLGSDSGSPSETGSEPGSGTGSGPGSRTGRDPGRPR